MKSNARKMMSLAAAGMLALGTLPALAEEVTEQEITMEQLPPAVAHTFRAELQGKNIEEIEQISYEGITVLYEAEYHEDGEEYEVYVYPNGQVAQRHSHEEQDEHQ